MLQKSDFLVKIQLIIKDTLTWSHGVPRVSVHWRNAVGRKLAEANDFGFLNIF